MEGVGARFGRSSTRYGGPAAVFTGPVRKWQKKWVHVPPPNSNNHHHTASNGTANGSNGSFHVQFYKWTPIVSSQLKDGSNNDSNGGDNGNAEPKNSSKGDDAAVEEPPKKRFKYIPVWKIWKMDLGLFHLMVDLISSHMFQTNFGLLCLKNKKLNPRSRWRMKISQMRVTQMQ
ncbi:uncharacterized protein LOC121788101 isoform X2 [Salvia splendens]|uniref:uncharacterized protein LOC121788101 isoform X2 n=1 Tax=Salvia splendens TaxID=180675 RepID=UPI001C26F51B|nr:uncharacterized protein LOC121788101 isoform X2 [Salvia splendens]